MKYSAHKINVRSIRKLANNEGLTVKRGKVVTYKSGWQVATEGITVNNAEDAMKLVRLLGGTCGVWYSDGIYYIDHSHRVNTKHEALDEGRKHAQISVYGWARDNLAYC